VSERIAQPAANRTAAHAGDQGQGHPVRYLLGGGIDGNEQLTAMTGVILIVLLAVLGVTIVRIRQLIWLHLFLGLLLLGPVWLKTASTGYRFLRYYTRAALYRAKGPPMLALRAMGPVVVISTAVVFVSGVVLLFKGPHGRGTLLTIHKASFIVWLGFMAIHVLGHLPALGRSLRAVQIGAADMGLPAVGARAGAVGRWIALSGAIVAGLVLALVLMPHFGVWTAPGALPHHHEH
jgi:hypothetical protein